MYIVIRKNGMPEEERDKEFRKIVADLEGPIPKPTKIFCSTAVKCPGDEEFVLIPHFKDCLDENGEFSEKKCERLTRKLARRSAKKS